MIRHILGFFDVLTALKNDNTPKSLGKNRRLAPVRLERLETREVPASITFTNSGGLVIDLRDNLRPANLQVGSVSGLVQIQIDGVVASPNRGIKGPIAISKVTSISVHGTEWADRIDLSGVATSGGFQIKDKKVQIFGGKGNDTIYGSGFGDEIQGGSGNDKIWGGAGNDFLYGNSENDELHGESGNDTLEGSDGNDKLFGGADNDTLHGQAGQDYFDGGTGHDKGRSGGEDKKNKNKWRINMEATY